MHEHRCAQPLPTARPERAWHWRQMVPADLDAVMHIAGQVHPQFPEDRAVFANKLDLYAEGALLLDSGQGPAGYCFAHPWHGAQPPPLNTILARIPASADALYLHDLALLPQAHGGGAGTAAIAILLAKAAGLHLERCCLVAVNGSVPFWSRQGFVVTAPVELYARLASYGADAHFMVRSVTPSSMR